ncbi:MAG: sodium:calcium antiporter [Promethearchaeota archaeon]|nr:MAG: sodium:calcium antiporter [Candidatus Lokiarchaeota archaeon]
MDYKEMMIISLAITMLIGGILLIAYMSNLVVKHAAKLASALGVSNLVIGITIVAIGTDIAEIINSIISCSIGHGDIDAGDSIGSVLTQITLIFGLLPIICGGFVVKRKQIIIIGSCVILSLILIYSVIEKGYFTRLNAIFIICSLVFYLMVIYNVTKSDLLKEVELILISKRCKSKKYHATIMIIGLLGVVLSSIIIVSAVIMLSLRFNANELIISFFILSIGTSLPELAVDINAIKRKNYNLAIGDILGSCIIDATISITIGQLFFPQEVSAKLIIPLIIYTIFASMLVIAVIAWREKVDKKSGILFICIYIGSYFFFFAYLFYFQ